MTVKNKNNSQCISENVKVVINKYFEDMDGHKPNGLYELVLTQVEKPLFETVMENTHGNISQAAELLGLNRGTLRNQLRKYGLDK